MATGFIPLSMLSIIATTVLWDKSREVAWKEFYAEYWQKQLKESLDRCAGFLKTTEIMLKTALKTCNQSVEYHTC